MPQKRNALIIGAGPAGLAAASELQANSDIVPTILEASSHIGGLSRTVVHNGNRMDLGGHRFFTKSSKVKDWWESLLPLQGRPSPDDIALGRPTLLSDKAGAPDPEKTDRVMLSRTRLSRILHDRTLFDYPIRPGISTIRKLGLAQTAGIMAGYAKARILPVQNEKTLEDFLVNRFGRPLYNTFFESYTQKVWGRPCREISAEWGRQRIKGLSISKALGHAMRQLVSSGKANAATETSLIGRFEYPKFGPGQLWETAAKHITSAGGKIQFNAAVSAVHIEKQKVVAVTYADPASGKERAMEADLVFSSMPIRDLINGLAGHAPEKVRDIAHGLVYRDFLTVGVLCKNTKLQPEKSNALHRILDNWIYVQESDVKLGRIQIFNNWSPYLVNSGEQLWLGLEYFCNEGDELWSKPDAAMLEFAVEELVKINVVERTDVTDGVVVRVPKAYPAYFGTYDQFDILRTYLDSIDNLFPIGRNGMHRYNNMDHSVLSAMVAVDFALGQTSDRNAIWAVNTEKDYHESGADP